MHRPDEREIRMLSALGRQAAIAIDNARLVGDLRRTLDELRAAQETLVRGATPRAVGELAAGAAHHLNNLTAVILGRTQLLLMKKPDPARGRSLKSVERAALDAADTVRRIQGFSRTAQAEGATHFDLNAVVQETIESHAPSLAERGDGAAATIDLVAELGTRFPSVSGHRLEIREVDHQPDLERDGRASRGRAHRDHHERRTGTRRISVRDSGLGMSTEVRRRAFEPFFTTKGVKRTGLGLAVAYGTIHRHGGQIAIDSALG